MPPLSIVKKTMRLALVLEDGLYAGHSVRQWICMFSVLLSILQIRKLRLRETQDLGLALHEAGGPLSPFLALQSFSGLLSSNLFFCHPHLPADSFWARFD